MEFPTSPGPWKFGYTDDLQAPSIVDANEDVVCVMRDGVTTKDGKLMAAAPEMLTALQAFTDVYGVDDVQRWMAVRDNARAAIAKATGK
jgi:hypothetical protein